MIALDRIIDGILAQAQATADEIIGNANERAAEIHKTAQAGRAGQQRETDRAAERECQEIISRAQSADRRNRRLALLEVKNLVIDEVISEAKRVMAELPDQSRFESIWQGNILLNNSIEALFESEAELLRDKVYEILSPEE